ncbi:MAG: hypothetical protein QOG82_2608 [Actinomycetota bacterium]|jgi:hypothetical protein|nr:hypothetical protein [Actinomycetota bacterium]
MTPTPSGGPDSSNGVKLRIDWVVVVRSAGLALAVAVPAIVLGATVARDSNVIVLLYFVLLGGQVAAGWYAGRHRLDAPLIHGALASLTSFLVLVVIVVGARAIAGKSGPDPFNLVFHAFMACSTGIFGALLASRTTKPALPSTQRPAAPPPTTSTSATPPPAMPAEPTPPAPPTSTQPPVAPPPTQSTQPPPPAAAPPTKSAAPQPAEPIPPASTQSTQPPATAPPPAEPPPTSATSTELPPPADA